MLEEQLFLVRCSPLYQSFTIYGGRACVYAFVEKPKETPFISEMTCDGSKVPSQADFKVKHQSLIIIWPLKLQYSQIIMAFFDLWHQTDGDDEAEMKESL